MKRISLFALLAALTVPLVGSAGSFTITYTAAQDTIIQTRILPAVNATKCAAFKLGPTCNSAALVTAGCVVVAFPAKNINHCTIYSLDAAGEGLFLQDEANRTVVDRFLQLAGRDRAAFLSSCNAASAAAKTSACTAVGAPATCNPCP